MISEIIHGSCLDVMKNFDNGTIQTIITSPPYNLEKKYEKKQDINDYLKFYIPVIEQFHRILKNEGTIFWQVGNYVDSGEIIPLDIKFYDLFVNFGFKLRNRIIWHFGHGLHTKYRFSGRHETIMLFTKSDDYVFNLDSVRIPQKYPSKKYFKGPRKGQLSCNPNGKNPGDVWNMTNVKHNHPEKTNHPCMFPQELCKRCILVGSNENDIVLDPFCGSGQAILSAVKNKRVGIGIEIDNNYCQLARKRLNETVKNS